MIWWTIPPRMVDVGIDVQLSKKTSLVFRSVILPKSKPTEGGSCIPKASFDNQLFHIVYLCVFCQWPVPTWWLQDYTQGKTPTRHIALQIMPQFHSPAHGPSCLWIVGRQEAQIKLKGKKKEIHSDIKYVWHANCVCNKNRHIPCDIFYAFAQDSQRYSASSVVHASICPPIQESVCGLLPWHFNRKE